MIKLAPVDQYIILAYFLFTFWLGFGRKNASDSTENFLVAGRRVTLPAFVASLVSTWYGGILGVGEFSYRFGISNWLVFGVPYYLCAIIFAIFLAGVARRSKHYTIPDQLEKVYGAKVRMAGAVFIFLLASPAPYLLMLGILLHLFLPVPIWAGILFSAGFSLLYIFRGGLQAVIRTDILQFVLMFLGFIILVVTAWTHYGGFNFLKEHLPAQHLTWHGGNSLQYILVWYVIAMATLVDANFYQRCFAAKSENVARWGIFVSVLFWLFFDFLTTTAGLYARVLLPELADPVQSFPRLAVFLLPNILQGVFFVALLATIMSTLDSFGFVSALTIGRDFLWRLRGGDDTSLNFYTRIGLLVTFSISVVIAIASSSIISIWYQLGSIATPALLLPLLTSFNARWKMSQGAAFVNIVFAGGISALWIILSLIQEEIPLGIDAVFPGLVISLIIYLSDNNLKKR
ncbi:MAG: sodium:solute symporter family protein [Deferribacteres bacterium]|nr:sodium:solute symporter family protein [candidate division KSB1 bacterium]MCB9503611.1 sodium:solute symporter family protein [Deferribacteres bacterium]